MNYNRLTKAQLINKLQELEQRIEKLEKAKSELEIIKEQLRTEKAYFDQMFESSQEAVAMVDNKGLILRINKQFTQLFGYSPKEAVGKILDELVAPPNLLPEARSITRKIQKGRGLATEGVRQRKNGRLINVSIIGLPIIINNQQVGQYAIYRNITDRLKMEEKLKASLQEKEVLLREIHHRVKNNMQIMASLFRLQSSRLKDKNLREFFNVGQNRIKSMALIHESLYRSSNLARIDFSGYVKKLTTHLLAMYSIEGKYVKLTTEVEDVYLDINRAIPCGLIINELVSNALKYAFPGNSKGEIVVRMFSDKGGKYKLIISDNGLGFPKNIDFRSTKTLGLQLVTDLVRQLDGHIQLEKDKGTTFKIEFEAKNKGGAR
ncbi:MAG: sensor histidine kinase [Candidatus Aminicenantales bacterium]